MLKGVGNKILALNTLLGSEMTSVQDYPNAAKTSLFTGQLSS